MKTDRLISILMKISNKELTTAKELSNYFEVSLRTIYRDIDCLCAAGIPIGSKGGVNGGYYILEEYKLENLQFNKNELKTFLALTDSLKESFGNKSNFKDILLKIQKSNNDKLYNKNLKINLSHFSLDEEIKKYLYTINSALEKNRLLNFDYINRNFEKINRTVEPFKLHFEEGNWWLIGFCRVRNEFRSFKLPRIQNLNIEKEFHRKEISEEEILKKFRKQFLENSIKIVFRFSKKSGERLTEYFKKENIIEKNDGYYVFEQFPDDEGLIKAIISFGKECEVLKPIEIRTKVKKYLEEMNSIYND